MSGNPADFDNDNGCPNDDDYFWWEITCSDCGETWAADYQPPACQCEDGGSWMADKQLGKWRSDAQA